MYSTKSLAINIVTILTIVTLVSCTSSPKNNLTSDKTNNNLHMLQASVWYKLSGENKALQYQAFNYATLKVKEYLRSTKRNKKKPAIVVDVDETILNNMPYQEYLIKSGNSYPVKWFDWVSKGTAKAIPGSVKFLNYVHKKGFEIFYVSNRKLRAVDVTYKNLKAAKLPVKKKNLLFRDKTSSKRKRRNTIKSKNYDIVLLIGDNLNDFTDAFDETSIQKRMKLVDTMRANFGDRFIILPNPLYGDWEGAVIDYKWKLTGKQRNELKKSLLDESPVTGK
jgi:5'-nucleotidase (lipoprotein e(P4) family)